MEHSTSSARIFGDALSHLFPMLGIGLTDMKLSVYFLVVCVAGLDGLLCVDGHPNLMLLEELRQMHHKDVHLPCNAELDVIQNIASEFHHHFIL